MREPKPQITRGKFQNVDLRVAIVRGAPIVEATRYPSRVLELDLGGLGTRTSVGQFALLEERAFVGAKVIACINLGEKRMDNGGSDALVSDALVLGTPHPDSPPGESQALPIWADPSAQPGEEVF